MLYATACYARSVCLAIEESDQWANYLLERHCYVTVYLTLVYKPTYVLIYMHHSLT